ncbi:alpha-amylase family glycosyl hydrolase, partial [Deinococcus sp. DB0503]|uniref:alpha-amylase family glycosyl hydrolase n=1 Tax=Deinococcus sp. DB0503 TaxID=2479203 RepID=UPI001EC54412
TLMEWFAGEHYLGFRSRMTTAELLDLLWDAYHVLAPQLALNQFNLLDSHDIPRALSRLGENKTKLRAALTLLMGYPGVPCLYYGTEIGLSQLERGLMPFNRAPMPWDETRWDLDLRGFVQALIRVRRSARVLQEGALRFLLEESDALGYLRAYTHPDGRRELAAVLGSRRGSQHEVTVTLPRGDWRDALTGELVSRGGETRLDVAQGRLLLA